ncbi:MAG: hypothetical protein HC794_04830 [Nitrospiraceae bacterium]|nr:hypothetical protein [Nitrospiraceae bacterium]
MNIIDGKRLILGPYGEGMAQSGSEFCQLFRCVSLEEWSHKCRLDKANLKRIALYEGGAGESIQRNRETGIEA